MRAWSSSSTRSLRERGAGQLEPQRRRRLDLLVPWLGRDDHDHSVQAERGPGSAEQRDVTEVWRIERAAEDPGHGMNWNDSSPSWTFDAAAGAGLAERTLELLLARRGADDAEAVLGTHQAPRAGLRLGAVDEELGDFHLAARRPEQARERE